MVDSTKVLFLVSSIFPCSLLRIISVKEKALKGKKRKKDVVSFYKQEDNLKHERKAEERKVQGKGKKKVGRRRRRRYRYLLNSRDREEVLE